VRLIAHISDLHFGRTDKTVLAGLHEALIAAMPDILVVSGDLTQRARKREFAQARDFLAQLPKPQIVVPGNHDVPLHNVFARWLRPLSNYRRYIGDETNSYYADSEVALLGINTARAFSLKNGRINRAQVARACATFGPVDANAIRMVVTHHPFSVADINTRHNIVGRAAMALSAFAECKVDIVLSGHLHAGHAELPNAVSPGVHTALLVQAGTASSNRTREEPNAFNLLHIEAPGVIVEQWGWAEDKFALARRQSFRRGGGSWAVEP
jgi:3',5'-cyclic AMP phosphodiesterase CpdA